MSLKIKQLNLNIVQSIRGKFRVFLGIIVVLFVLSAIFFGYSIQKVFHYRDYRNQINTTVIEYLTMRRLEQQFLATYSEDNDFFRLARNSYLERYESSYSKLIENITILQEHNLTSVLFLNETILKFHESVEESHTIFQDLTRKIYERGSNETGIIGNMRIAQKAAFANVSHSVLRDYIIQLRKIENDYLQGKNSLYQQQFIKTFEELNKYLSGNRNNIEVDSLGYLNVDSLRSTDEERRFIVNMNDYKRYFIILIRINNEIGISSSDGLIGVLNEKSYSIDNKIKKLQKLSTDEKEKAVSESNLNMYILLILILLILVLYILYFARKITQPLYLLREYLTPLGKGILPESLPDVKKQDELSEMQLAVNDLITGLRKTTQFAATIGNSVFNTDFKPLSDQDALGNSLLDMRENLTKAKQEEEKRKYEDSLRKWTNEGLAKFSDILRQSTSDLNVLAASIIKNLVHYLNANQGGLFIYNENDKDDVYLELIAMYAYNHEKRKQKKIYLGEGLVGTCAVEKATIYMTDVPDNYLNITSGLGGANPRSLLIVPLKLDEQIFGVTEIASFQKLGKHEIVFVEKVSESIASTLSIAHINARTAILLEQSQQQAEEMAAQEEEMRQNLEELLATQEESARREAELNSILNAINTSSLVIEYDLNGKILEIDNEYLKLLEATRDRVVGKYQSDLTGVERISIQYRDFWNELSRGITIRNVQQIKFENREIWVTEIYTPILDSDGEVVKILNLASDITQNKKLEIELREQADVMVAQEEEMRQNLEELQATQDEMERKQQELEEANLKMKSSQDEMEKKQQELESANKKMRANEEVLKKAFEKMKETEKKVKEQNAALLKAQEELRLKENKLLEQNSYVTDQQEELLQNLEELKAAQEEMMRKESELQGFLEAVNAALIKIEYDPDTTILNVNENFLAESNLQLNQFIGRKAVDFISTEEGKNEFREMWKRVLNGEIIKQESELGTDAENKRWLYTIYAPVKNEEGEVVKVINLSNDITKQKLLEIEAKEQAQKLEHQRSVMQQHLKKLTATQKEMSRKEAELRGLIEAVDVALIKVEYSTNAEFISANENFEKATGYLQKDLIGKSVRELLPEGEHEKFNLMWENLLKGIMFNGEVKRRKLNGDEEWLHVSYSPVKDDEENIIKILYLGVDITKQKMLEIEANQKASQLAENLEKLRIAQEEMEKQNREIEKAKQKLEVNEVILRKALQHAKDREKEIKEMKVELEKEFEKQTVELRIKHIEMQSLALAVDKALLRAEYALDGTILSVNQTYCEINNTTEQEIIGKNVRRWIPERDKENFEKLWKTVVEQGNAVRYEALRVIGEGERWILTIYQPMIDQEGKVMKICYLGADITESKLMSLQIQKHVEELKILKADVDKELEKKKTEIRGVIQAVDSVLIEGEYDIDGNILRVNQNYEEVTGYNSEFLMGKNVRMFVAEEDKENFEKLWQKIREGEIFKGLTKRKVAQREVWLMASYTPVKNEKGEVYRVYYLGQNITEAKILEITAQKQLEETSRKQNEIAAIWESLQKTVGTFEMNRERKIISANDIFAKMIRQKTEDFIDKKHSELILYNKINQEEYEMMWENFEGGISYIMEIVYQTSKGEIWLHESYTLLQNENGELEKVVAIAVNLNK